MFWQVRFSWNVLQPERLDQPRQSAQLDSGAFPNLLGGNSEFFAGRRPAR